MSLSVSLWWPHNPSWLCNDIVFMRWKIASCFSKVFKAYRPPEGPLYRETKQCFPSFPDLAGLDLSAEEKVPFSSNTRQKSLSLPQNSLSILFYKPSPESIQLLFKEKKAKRWWNIKAEYKEHSKKKKKKESRAILSLKVTFIL